MTIYNIGNRVVNNYLFAIDEGHILIDTEYENGFARFHRNLKKLNIQPSGYNIHHVHTPLGLPQTQLR